MVNTTAGEISYRISAQDDATKVLSAVNDLFSKLRKNISDLTPDINLYQQTTKKLSSEINNSTSYLNYNSDAFETVRENINENAKSYDAMNNSIGGVTESINDQTSEVKNLAAQLIALGASLSFMKKFASDSLNAAKDVEITKTQLNAMAETFNYSGKSGLYAAESVDAFRNSLESMSSYQANAIKTLGTLGYDVEWVTSKYSELKDIAYVVNGSVSDVARTLGGSTSELSELGIVTTQTKEIAAKQKAVLLQGIYRSENPGKTLSYEAALAQARAEVYADDLEEFESLANTTYTAAMRKFEEIKTKFKESVGKIYTTILSPILGVATAILDFIASNPIVTWIVAIGGAIAILIPTIAGIVNIFGKLSKSIKGAYQEVKKFITETIPMSKVGKAFKSTFGDIAFFGDFKKDIGMATSSLLRRVRAEKLAIAVEEKFGVTNIMTAAGLNANSQAQLVNNLEKLKGNGVASAKLMYEEWMGIAMGEETAEIMANTVAQEANNNAKLKGNKITLTSLLKGKVSSKMSDMGISPILKSSGGVGILKTLKSGLSFVWDILKSIVKVIGRIFTFLGPIKWIIAGIIALIAAIKTNFAGIGDLFKEIWEGIKGIFTAFAEPFKEFFGSVKDGTGVFGVLASIIKPLIDLIRAFFAFVMPIFQGVAKFVGTILVSALKLVWGIISGIFEVIGTLFGSLFGDGQDALDGAADTGQNILDGITYVCDIISDFMDFIMPAIKAVGWVIGNIIIAPLKAVIDAITSFLKWLGILSDEAEETEESMDKTEKHLSNSANSSKTISSNLKGVTNGAYTTTSTAAPSTTFGSVARSAYDISNTASLSGTASSLIGRNTNSYVNSSSTKTNNITTGDTNVTINVTNVDSGNKLTSEDISREFKNEISGMRNELYGAIT